jgi:hypothetical protein
MQRVRQSIPFYKQNGWNPIIVCVDKKYIESYTDDSLLQTIPNDIEVITVKAFSYRLTRLFGLGDLGLRSLLFYFFTLKKLLKKRKIDLIFFSTTMFNVLITGKYLKKIFNVPYIIDIQDPWLDYTKLEKPKELRPKKFWFSHTVSKLLEPRAIKNADGVIAVTQQYIDTLKSRYTNITDDNSEVITFGFSEADYHYAENITIKIDEWNSSKDFIKGVYTGVVNKDMLPVIRTIFKAFKLEYEKFNRVKLFFIGTNYASGKYAAEMVMPLARESGIENRVVEVTSRIPYLEALKIQKEADFLMLIGSTNKAYTASKLYPYLYAKKPILAVFHEESSVSQIMRELNGGTPITFSIDSLAMKSEDIQKQLTGILENINSVPTTDFEKLKKYSAEELTKKHVRFFNKIIDKTSY